MFNWNRHRQQGGLYILSYSDYAGPCSSRFLALHGSSGKDKNGYKKFPGNERQGVGVKDPAEEIARCPD